MQDNSNNEWRKIFCGRDAELKILHQKFQDVRNGKGPRFVAILGDRGMGKTRLAQEFYCELSADITLDPDNYWPDGKHRMLQEFLVAPAPDDAHFGFAINSRKMNFLWWGFRLTEIPANSKEARNLVTATLQTHRKYLNPHLRYFILQKNLSQLDSAAQKIKKLGIDIAKDVTENTLTGFLPSHLANIIKKIGQTSLSFIDDNLQRESIAAEAANATVPNLDAMDERDQIEIVKDQLKAFFETQDGQSKKPMIMLIDDAHNARIGGDEGTQRFINEIWDLAVENSWPLLILATHWKHEWGGFAEHQRKTSFAAEFAAKLRNVPESGTIIDLSIPANLDEMIVAGLPELNQESRKTLADKFGDNPHYMVEAIIEIKKRQFENGDWIENGNLSNIALRNINSKKFELEELILSRLEDATRTPIDVKRAIAIASLEGMQFTNEIIIRAAQILEKNVTHESLKKAESPGYFVGGIESGSGNFLQQIYFKVANSNVELWVSDLEKAKSAILQAANEIAQNATDAETQTNALGIVAGFGAASSDKDEKLKAAQALLEMVKKSAEGTGGKDLAAAASYARQFEKMLDDGEFEINDFGVWDYAAIGDAISEWFGEPAGNKSYKRMLKCADYDLSNQYNSHNLVNKSFSLLKFGFSVFSISNATSALNYFCDSYRVSAEAFFKYGTTEALRYMCSSLVGIGDCENEIVGPNRAIQFFESSLKLLMQLKNVIISEDIVFEASEIMSKIAKCKRQFYGPEHAASYYSACVKYIKELIDAGVENASEHGSRKSLVSCLLGLGECESELKHPELALSLYEECLIILRVLAVRHETRWVKRNLVLNLLGIASCDKEINGSMHALRYINESLEVAKQLEYGLISNGDRRIASICFAQIGLFKCETSDYEPAIAFVMKSIARRRVLSKKLNTASAKRELVDVLTILGTIYSKLSKKKSALIYFTESLQMSKQLLSEGGNIFDAQKHLMICEEVSGKLIGNLNILAWIKLIFSDFRPLKRALGSRLLKIGLSKNELSRFHSCGELPGRIVDFASFEFDLDCKKSMKPKNATDTDEILRTANLDNIDKYLSINSKKVGIKSGSNQTANLISFDPDTPRNVLCPCGSGKRFKHCHGAIGGEA
jgi:tetratricopeptide (TPR) repeat protein